MIRSLFVVKDDLAASFMFFGDHVNDEVAARTFKISCSEDSIPYKDLSLYRIAKYDTDTGVISDSSLEFICRGEKYEKE